MPGCFSLEYGLSQLMKGKKTCSHMMLYSLDSKWKKKKKKRVEKKNEIKNCQQSMNKFPGVADRLVAFDAKFGSINPAHTEPDSKVSVVSQSQVNKTSVTSPMENLVPDSTTLPAISKSQHITDVGKANQMRLCK